MPHRLRSASASYFLRLTILFCLYFTAGKLGLSAPFTSGNVSPFWPASGVALAGVLLWGYSMWPAIAGAAFLVNFWSSLPAEAALGMALGNTCAALAGGFLLRRVAGLNIHLRLRDIIAILTLGAFVSPMVAATAGTVSLSLAGVKAWSGWGTAFRVWWFGDGMGILMVTPLILSLRDTRTRLRTLLRGELLGLLLGTTIVVLVIFSHTLGQFIRDDVLAFAVFPFVIWAAIRFRLPGASLICLLIAIVAIWGTSQGHGPFVRHSALHNAILLQLFLAILSISGLFLAAVIVERADAEEALRKLSGRLLRLQDAERRRLARELHDSSGQHLVALQMNLSMLSRVPSHDDAERANLLTRCQEILERVVKEIRTLSHLLYPPLLDEAGLVSALRWYIDGLVERSGLEVELDISQNFERLPEELETTIFRIVQECLTNIHRHSGSLVARISLVRLPSQVLLRIRDEGRGIGVEFPDDRTQFASDFGVGIRGISERVHELRGQLKIKRAVPGTLVEVIFPVPADKRVDEHKATAMQA